MLTHPAITDQTVCVTGAGGSIGTVLCRHLLQLRPAKLVCLNLTEAGLVALERSLTTDGADQTVCQYVLGSVCDPVLMAHCLARADVLLHLASYKHVPCCEANPSVAVSNNVGGTLTVLQVAQAAQVQQCVVVSTDKAVAPASIMGAAKLVSERLVAGVGLGAITVRFGNVLDSTGSVLPLWREQIAQGGPVTITDPACTRFFMSSDEAVELIVEVLRQEPETGTFMFDMGEPQSLLALAQSLLAKQPYGFRIPLVYTGLRPGEKLEEQLCAGIRMPTSHPKVFAVPSAPPLRGDDTRLAVLLEAARQHEGARTRELLWSLVVAEEEADVAD